MPIRWHSLNASETHNIPLFGEELLKKIDQCKSYFLLKVLLLPYITWLDHSILQHLVLCSQSKAAERILDDFIFSIDYTQPITSYPIPSPSQLMIPLDGSNYTLVATQCEFEFSSLALEKVVHVRDVLIELWEITPHAIQLTAVHIQERLLYWMIPKCVAGLIADRTPLIQYKLWKNRIVMCTIFPVNFSSPGYPESAAKSGPFSLLNSEVIDYVFLLPLMIKSFHFPCATLYRPQLKIE